MAEAGYPEGFELVMDCPNDRYVNDEEICQAVTAMLGRIGVKVTLNALPKAQYFEKVSPPKYDSSFNLLGWTPGSLDSWNVLANLVICRDAKGKGGTFNFGGYCNPKIDELTRKILVEQDTAKRDAMIGEAFRLLQRCRHDSPAPAGSCLGRDQGHAGDAAGRRAHPLRVGAETLYAWQPHDGPAGPTLQLRPLFAAAGPNTRR